MDALEDRIARTVVTVCELGKKSTSVLDRERLLGKAEGLQLALTYLREAPRV